MAETTDHITPGGGTALAADPLAALLPDPQRLTEPQIRGRDCAWCAVTLGAGSAIDLGERSASHGAVARWFPRSCQSCARQHVYPAQLDHTQNCEQCTDDPTVCAHGTWLRLVLRQARR
ncbi:MULTISPECIES: hypothetical protein [unclassified Streptomyces]|uniref:Uncharacterized protein n=1 Tax=Streptomyces sp. NBC_00119 TaxID=2975659 RepID=A0AAU1U4L1_9ACTN|nr:MULTISPECIES: hypothetical protein [unclassified Streptomyces]MCX4641468.1 hypothetical protein [Streptomyces sp. NBC_01446]MCX5322112.1 hypothetical protein [Streptomyces sp. NBC_00120]